MNRNEQQMYSDITSIRKSLEKIANVLEHMNHDSYLAKQEIPKFQDIPEDEYTCDNDLIHYHNDILHDSDYSIRVAASNAEEDYATKKDAILDYVESEFGSKGAKYTDIIKFAYYLGAHNAPKYTSENRGYYSCAFSFRMNGHLIQGGKDYLVKGINDEGKERYFTLSKVNYHTNYWKRIGR